MEEEDDESTVLSPIPLPQPWETSRDSRLAEAEEDIKLIKRTLEMGFSELKAVLNDIKTPLQAAPIQQSSLSVEGGDQEEDAGEGEEGREYAREPELTKEEIAAMGPFAQMTKMKLFDLAMSDPDQIYAIRTGRPRGDGTIRAMPETMRWRAQGG